MYNDLEFLENKAKSKKLLFNAANVGLRMNYDKTGMRRICVRILVVKFWESEDKHETLFRRLVAEAGAHSKGIHNVILFASTWSTRL